MPGPSSKRLKPEKAPDGPSTPDARTLREPSAFGRPVTYLEAAGTSQKSSKNLSRPDLLNLKNLLQDKLIKENLGFPVRNSNSNFNRRTIRLCFLCERSHDYMKTLINSAPDFSYQAQSSEELPHLMNFGARVSTAIDFESIIKVLYHGNPAVYYSKLHIKGWQLSSFWVLKEGKVLLPFEGSNILRLQRKTNSISILQPQEQPPTSLVLRRNRIKDLLGQSLPSHPAPGLRGPMDLVALLPPHC